MLKTAKASALGVTGVFVAGCLLWTLAVNLIAGMFLVLSGAQAASPEQFAQELGGLRFSLLSVLQILGFAGVALALALREPLALSFPMRSTPMQSVLALLSGLTVWLFPSWVAQELMELFDLPATSMEILAELLVTGSLLDRVAVGFAIVVSAPILEELVYRGFLWRVIEPAFGWAGALTITTLLFALSHLDAVQSAALLPTALFLGWLRHTSGSLLAPIVVHLTNNGIGLLLVLGGLDEEARISWWAGLIGLVMTLGWAWVAELTRRRASSR